MAEPSRLVPRAERERGAALVEMTIVGLLLLILASGILEYGNLFGSAIDISAASRDAARAGVASTSVIQPDSAVIASLRDRSGLKTSQIEKVVIYRANDAEGKVPQACLDEFPPPAGSKCNVYRAQDLDLDLFAAPGSGGWPTSARVGGSDFLGVYVKVKYGSLTNLVWSPTKYSDQVAMLIEPKSNATYKTPFDGFTVGNAPVLERQWEWSNKAGQSCDGDCAYKPAPANGKGKGA